MFIIIYYFLHRCSATYLSVFCLLSQKIKANKCNKAKVKRKFLIISVYFLFKILLCDIDNAACARLLINHCINITKFFIAANTMI